MQNFVRSFRSHPMLWMFLTFVLIPLMALLGWAYSFVIDSTPDTVGTEVVKGIQAPVKITRDEHGVTYINAKYDQDVFFAIGFAHAQDRMWQLELQRRMTQGRLAEIFGRSAMGFDVYARTLGMDKNAKLSWDSLSDEARAALNAYTSGINSWLHGGHTMTLEFTLLGVEPEDWQPTDSLAWIKMFGLLLAGNYQKDLSRLIMAQSLPTDKAQMLAGAMDADDIVTAANVNVGGDTVAALEKLSALGDFSKTIEQQWGIGSKNIGSNAWVVSAEHGKDGLATLANDPHLGIALPSQWYAVNLKGDKLDVAGMSLVGLPIVMLGKNKHIAWGSTNMMADSMDLYYEQINTQNENQYKRDDQWVEFDTRVETIKVKADFPSFLRVELDPIKVKVRDTDHGPMITDMLGKVGQPMSLRWVGGSRKDTSFDAFLALNYANDWTTFKQSMEVHVAPAMNMFYLDAQQNIGYLGVGKIPVRGKGVGNLPIEGWKGEYGWQGFIPFDDMPQSYNPEKGYLLSANNRAVGAEYPYFISQDWADPQRAERIDQLLREKIDKGEKFSIEDHQVMQQDLMDLQAVAMLPELTNIANIEQEDQEPLEMLLSRLRDWDGNTDVDSVATTIFVTWMRHLRGALFGDEFKSYFGNPSLKARQRMIVSEVSLPMVHAALTSTKIDWCDDMETSEKESCDEIKIDALKATFSELWKLKGDDLDDWAWGDVHQAVYEHRPFSNIKGLDIIYERSVSRGGSPNSINMSTYEFSPDKGYTQSVGPAFRQLVQFSSEGSQYWYMNTTGQSANVVSEHYDDLIDPFIEGQYYLLSDKTPQSIEILNLVLSQPGQKGE